MDLNTHLNRLLNRLRRNDPNDTRNFLISLRCFQNDNDVAAVAQALRGNEYAKHLDLSFNCLDTDGDGPPISFLDWNPLLRAIETRQELEMVDIWTTPTGRLVPLFRDHFFQSLQQNPNLQAIYLYDINFSSDNSASFVSFLDTAPSLRFLSFSECRTESGDTARMIAASLSRNSRIQTLYLSRCRPNFLCPVLQSLSTAPSASTLKTLSYEPFDIRVERTDAEALVNYLESASATIQSFILHSFVLILVLPEALNILQSLSRNTSITEVTFTQCSGPFRGFNGSTPRLQLLANLIREKSNLVTLRIENCNFCDSPVFCDALAEVLRRRASPLRCLDFTQTFGVGDRIPHHYFRTLMSDIVASHRLERLVIREIDSGEAGHPHLQTLLIAIPLFKVKDITLWFSEHAGDDEQLRILAAFKRNFVVQSVQCKTSRDNGPWFNATHQTRLDFYVNRNRKLSEWQENPNLVPRELWSYAMMLALNAGMNTFYQSLLALSGEGVGLRDRGQKRKRTEE